MTRLSDSFPAIPENSAGLVGKTGQLDVYVVIYRPQNMTDMFSAMVPTNDPVNHLREPVENTDAGRELIGRLIKDYTGDVPLAWTVSYAEETK